MSMGEYRDIRIWHTRVVESWGDNENQSMKEKIFYWPLNFFGKEWIDIVIYSIAVWHERVAAG